MMAKIKLKTTLEKLIRDRKISARELSRQTNIPQSTINNFLMGKGSHKPEQILAMAQYFGTSMEFLLFGEDSRPPTLDDVLTEEIFEGWLKVKIERAIPNKRKG